MICMHFPAPQLKSCLLPILLTSLSLIARYTVAIWRKVCCWIERKQKRNKLISLALGNVAQFMCPKCLLSNVINTWSYSDRNNWTYHITRTCYLGDWINSVSRFILEDVTIIRLECPSFPGGLKFITIVIRLECPDIQGGRKFIILVIQMECPGIQCGRRLIAVVIQMECPGIQKGRKFITTVFQLECPGIQGGRCFVILVIQVEFPHIQGGRRFIIVGIELKCSGIRGGRSYIILVIKLECPCFQGRPAGYSILSRLRQIKYTNPHVIILI